MGKVLQSCWSFARVHYYIGILWPLRRRGYWVFGRAIWLGRWGGEKSCRLGSGAAHLTCCAQPAPSYFWSQLQTAAAFALFPMAVASHPCSHYVEYLIDCKPNSTSSNPDPIYYVNEFECTDDFNAPPKVTFSILRGWFFTLSQQDSQVVTFTCTFVGGIHLLFTFAGSFSSPHQHRTMCSR